MSDPTLSLWYNFAADKNVTDRINGLTLGVTRALATGTVFNSQGLVEVVAANTARLDFDSVTGQSLGLLVEESRENVCLHNRDGTDAVWVKLNMTAAKDQVGEDGVANSASSLLATAGNATAIQAFTIGSTAQTGTFSIKRLIGTGDVDITIDDGVTFTTVNINSLTWTRFDVTQTLANPDIGVRIVTSGDKIAIDFQGLEAGAFPTSRIATVASSVTRNADLVQTTDVSWYNVSVGTLYVEASETNATARDNFILELSDNSASDRILFQRQSNQDQRFLILGPGNDASLIDVDAWDTANTLVRSAAAWALNDAEHFVNGVRSGTGDQVVDIPTGISDLNVGSGFDESAVFNGHIAEIRYYNVRKDNQFLEDLSNGLISEDGLAFVRTLDRPLARPLARNLSG